MATFSKWPSSPSTMAAQSDGILTRSISFGVASPPTTPMKTLDPSSTTVGWTAELEERLQAAQREMEAHQRRWSPHQEDYVAEVERLLEMKRRFREFARRRSKDHQREGRSLERASSRSERGESPADEEEIAEVERSLICIPRKPRSPVVNPRGRKRRNSRDARSTSSNNDPSPSKTENEGQGRLRWLGRSLRDFFLKTRKPRSPLLPQQTAQAS